jgi:hypothetical protein
MGVASIRDSQRRNRSGGSETECALECERKAWDERDLKTENAVTIHLLRKEKVGGGAVSRNQRTANPSKARYTAEVGLTGTCLLMGIVRALSRKRRWRAPQGYEYDMDSIRHRTSSEV